MSSAAGLGLLSGLGRGMSLHAERLEKNRLAEAEEQRQMNLLNLKRQWDQEDYATRRADSLADKEADRTYTEEQKQKWYDIAKEDEQGQYDRNRSDTLADKEADKTWEMEKMRESARLSSENRAPSAFQEKIQYLDDLKTKLDNKEITEEEYREKASLVTGKKDGTGRKDYADQWNKNYKIALEQVQAGKGMGEKLTAEDEAKVASLADRMTQHAFGQQEQGGRGGLLSGNWSTSAAYAQARTEAIDEAASSLAGKKPEEIAEHLKRAVSAEAISAEEAEQILEKTISIESQDQQRTAQKEIKNKEREEAKKQRWLETLFPGGIPETGTPERDGMEAAWQEMQQEESERTAAKKREKEEKEKSSPIGKRKNQIAQAQAQRAENIKRLMQQQ